MFNLRLIIVRGIPGSGKSTLAKALVVAGYADVNFEADMFFVGPSGVYHFVPRLIPVAHEWCIRKTREALSNNKNVVVSNTFTLTVFLNVYREMAEIFSAQYQEIICMGEFKGIHPMSLESLEKFKKQAWWYKHKGE